MNSPLLLYHDTITTSQLKKHAGHNKYEFYQNAFVVYPPDRWKV